MTVVLWFLGIFILLAIIIAVILVPKGLVKIEQDEIGIVIREVSQRRLSTNQKIALNGEAGPQPDILTTGLYWKLPWVYSIRKVPTIQIPPGEIGIVFARDGARIPPERQLGKVVECDNFQDARAFLTNGGQQGRQLSILTDGEYRINTELFTVITSSSEDLEKFDVTPHDLRVYEVEVHNIGIVKTLDGASIPNHEDTFAGPIVPDHDNFQNGQVFIDGGGYMGLQEEVLLTGKKNLNPWFVKVEQVPMVYIKPGTVGVVVSHVGKTSDGEGLVMRGYKGVWQKPLEPGRHAINTRVMDVIIVPTYEIALDWSDKQKPPSNYDAQLQALTLHSSDRFMFDIEVTQVISIRKEDAPRMISRIGSPQIADIGLPTQNNNSDLERYSSIRNLITRKLEPLISSHFRDSAQNYKALDFYNHRRERQEEAEEYIRAALEEYGVNSIGTYIHDIDLPQALDDLDKVLQEREVAREKRLTFQEQQRTKEEELKLGLIDTKYREQAAEIEAESEKHGVNVEVYKIRETGKAEAEAEREKGEAAAATKRALIESYGGFDNYITLKEIEEMFGIQLPPPSLFGGSNLVNTIENLLAQRFALKTEQQDLLSQGKINKLLEGVAEQYPEVMVLLRSLDPHTKISDSLQDSLAVLPSKTVNETDVDEGDSENAADKNENE